jgi:hypothetical protein
MPTLNELRNSPPTFDRALVARQGITARLLRRSPLDRASAHQVQGLYHRFFFGLGTTTGAATGASISL